MRIINFLPIAFIALFGSKAFTQSVSTDLQFKVSIPYAVFNCIETALNRPGTSSTFHDLINQKLGEDKEFQEMCKEFQTINIYYDFKWSQFPDTRRQYRSTYDLLINSLVRSNSYDEIRNQISGLFPVSDQEHLIDLLKRAENKYRLIFNETDGKDFQKQLVALEEIKLKGNGFFEKMKRFYNSDWPDAYPFTVSFYPITGESGTTTATPHVNSLCVGVLTKEKDMNGRMGVVFHEMSHVLYDQQGAELQHVLDGYFKSNANPFAKLAQQYFDEALATAVGNGWVYQQLSGAVDTSEWYGEETINQFAKSIFPLVGSYMNENKKIDQAFVNAAIELFEKNLPMSLYSFANSLNSCVLYFDPEPGVDVQVEIDKIFLQANKYFQMSNVNISSPIIDPISIEKMRNEDMNQVIILNPNNKSAIKEIKKVHTQLKPIEFKPNTLIGFRDKKGRNVIVVAARNDDELDSIFKKMIRLKYFDPKNLIQQ